MRDKI